jgi:hypothetical protein
MAIPVIDMFVGPGGLGEGFASLRDSSGEPVFRIRLSVEKDSAAHKTLGFLLFSETQPWPCLWNGSLLVKR